MIKQFLLFIIFFTHLTFAQSIQTDTGTNKEANTLSSQINDIGSALEQLKKATKTTASTDSDMDKLLAEMPVNADNIDSYIDDFIGKKAVASTEQLQEVNQLTDKLSKSKDAIATKQQYLLEEIEELSKQEEIVKSMQQLLDNPLNQKQISPEELQTALQFNTTIEQLKTHYSATENHYQQQIQQLDNAIALLNRWSSALTNSQLQNATDTPSKHSEKVRLSDLQKRYQEEAKTLISELNQKRSTAELTEIAKLQETIYQKQTMAWLVTTDIELAKIVKDNFTLTDDVSDFPIDVLEQQLAQVNRSLKKLGTLKKNIEDGLADFKKRQEITGQTTLDDEFNQRLKSITFQQLQLANKPAQLTQLISHQQQHRLLTRQIFFSEAMSATDSNTIYQSLVQIAYQVKISFTTLIQKIIKNPYEIIALTALGVFLLFAVSKITKRYLSTPLKKYAQKMGIGIGARKVIYAIGKHRYFLLVMLFLDILTDMADIPHPSDSIIRTLIYSSVGIVIWLELAKIETKLHTLSGYFRKRNIMISFILLTTILLYTLAKMSSVAPALVLIYEKLLMLAMIAFAWTVRTSFMQSLKHNKSQLTDTSYDFYKILIKGLSWFVIGVCMINLIGYNRVAWIIFAYLGVMALYVLALATGLIVINHLRKQMKLYCLKRFEHGAFIAQDIISPVSLISKILWFWGITATLFNIMGWTSSSYLVNQVLVFFNYPLVTFAETSITLLLITLSVLAIYLVFHIAKWLKTFSYHWLYAKVSDLGLRNSLAIFTQYIAILAGVLIAMNILGIDLTSLAVFAGALGVGVGLGLQDIAKNFISGILLLIERPLRSGDWVSIDGSEGTVKSIGMRAITLETFDKQEVIVPNGNAIGNSFTNYTHHNSIIRTVLYIGAGYACDPNLVIDTLKKVLDNTKGILKDPAAKVIMWEYADSSINYRVQYYLDMDDNGILDTKTEVLRAIWYAFEENNIEMPFPQRDINFRNLLQKEEIKAVFENGSDTDSK